MTRVLLAAQSWVTYSGHQKGFDTFTTSEYVEGAEAFLGALRDRGHDVRYVPALFDRLVRWLAGEIE